jgi:hypothetical protein
MSIVVSYVWSEINSLNVAVLANIHSSSTMANSLVSGTLTIMDNDGAKGVDTVSVIVKSSPVYTLSLQSANNPNEI